MTGAPTTRPAVECGCWIWSHPRTRSSGPLRRILLIDDTPEIAELLTFALRDHGFEVFATGYTDTVNDLVSEQHSDALVLDCSAFDMSASLFDTVRDHPNHAELPVVIISATPQGSDATLRPRYPPTVSLAP